MVNNRSTNSNRDGTPSSYYSNNNQNNTHSNSYSSPHLNSHNTHSNSHLNSHLNSHNLYPNSYSNSHISSHSSYHNPNHPHPHGRDHHNNPHPNSYLNNSFHHFQPSSSSSTNSSSSTINWTINDEVDNLIYQLLPQHSSNEKRDQVRLYLQSLLNFHLKDYSLLLAEAGSTWTRTYLPDGDLDLVLHIGPQKSSMKLDQSSSASVPSMFDIIHIIYNEMISHSFSLTNKQYNGFVIRNLEFINARTKLLTCLVNNISVDITLNQHSTINNPLFLSLADDLIYSLSVQSLKEKEKEREEKKEEKKGIKQESYPPNSSLSVNTHLLKRSLLLIKTWCLHDSSLYSPTHLSLLLSKKGTMSTSALNLLVLFVFNVFYPSIKHPLDALRFFFALYRNFPWDTYIISLDGLIPINPSSTTSSSSVSSSSLPSSSPLSLHDDSLTSNCDDSSLLSSASTPSTSFSTSTPYQMNIEDYSALFHGTFDYSTLLIGKISNIFKPIYDNNIFKKFQDFTKSNKYKEGPPFLNLNLNGSISASTSSSANTSSSISNSSGPGGGIYSINIPIKSINIIDPCDSSNNLGISVSKFNLPTIKKTLESAFLHFEALILQSEYVTSHHNDPILSATLSSSFISSHFQVEAIKRFTYDLFPITYSTYIFNISMRQDLLEHPIQANHQPMNDFDHSFKEFLKSPPVLLAYSSTYTSSGSSSSSISESAHTSSSSKYSSLESNLEDLEKVINFVIELNNQSLSFVPKIENKKTLEDNELKIKPKTVLNIKFKDDNEMKIINDNNNDEKEAKDEIVSKHTSTIFNISYTLFIVVIACFVLNILKETPSSSSSSSASSTSSSTSSNISDLVNTSKLNHLITLLNNNNITNDAIENISKIISENIDTIQSIVFTNLVSTKSASKSSTTSSICTSTPLPLSLSALNDDNLSLLIKETLSSYHKKNPLHVPIHWISLGSSLTLGDFKDYNEKTGKFSLNINIQEHKKYKKYVWIINKIPLNQPSLISSLQEEHHLLLQYYLFYDHLSQFISENNYEIIQNNENLIQHDKFFPPSFLSKLSQNQENLSIILTQDPILSLYNLHSNDAGHYFCYELLYDDQEINLEIIKIMQNQEITSPSPSSWKNINLLEQKELFFKLFSSNSKSHQISLLTSSILQISRPSRVKLNQIFHELHPDTSQLRLDIELEDLGYPLPSFLWKKNGYNLKNQFDKPEENDISFNNNEIIDDTPYKIVKKTIKDDNSLINPSGISSLFLTSSSFNDEFSGTYTCVVENFASSVVWTEACIQVSKKKRELKEKG